MPRTPEQNAAIKEKRKGKILDHALTVFATYSYDDVTIDTITKAVGCSHGLFYHYYPSKEDVFRDIYSTLIVNSPAMNAYREAVTTLHGMDALRRFAEIIAEIEVAPLKEYKAVMAAINAVSAETIDRAETDIKDQVSMARELGKKVEEAQAEGHYPGMNPEQVGTAFMLFWGAVLRARRRKIPAMGKDVILATLGH